MLSARSIFVIFMKIIFHPVIIISLFGPIIIHINLSVFRDSINLSKDTTEIVAGLTGLKKAMSDVWVFALIDFSIQLYTTLLSWILLLIDAVLLIILLVKHSNDKKWQTNKLIHILGESKFSMALAVLIVILFIGGCVLFFSGHLSDIKTITYYLPEGSLIKGGMRIPPFSGFLTWFRGTILICGILMVCWKQYIFPKIIHVQT